MRVHDFPKVLFDILLTVLWIYVPMFYFGLNSSPGAWLFWFVDLVSLSVILFLLHRKGAHSLYG